MAGRPAARCDDGQPEQIAAIATYHHLTYVSSATTLFSDAQLADLLHNSRLANERLGITGMLLYRDGNFMQTIEGPEDAIAGLRERLREDARHKGMLILLSGTRDRRLFDGWSMGFTNLAENDIDAMPGYSTFLDVPLTAETFGENPAASQRLLLTFKRSLR